LLQFGVAANDRARWWASDISQVYFLAVVTTILFVAHPIHTEAVANIKGRDEIVTLLGSLAAIYLSFKAFYSRRPLLHLAVGTIFFLALLSKENAITFLAVAPLSYYIFTQAKLPKIIFQTIPFILGAVLFLILRSSIVPLELGGEPTLELMNNPFVKVENGQYTHFTSGEKWATIFYTLGHYLQLLVFPHPLTHDYYPRHIDIVGFAHPKVLLSMLVYAALAVYAVVGLLRKDILSYGILFYLATLSIASNIVFPIGTTMSERFAFMPSIGYCWVVAVLLQRWGRSRVQQGKKNDWAAMRLPLLLVGAMTLLFSIKTISRNTVWKNNYTLFTTDVHTSVNSAKLRNAAAGETINAATNEANKSRQQQMYREAEEHLQMAIRIHPNYKNAYLQLGNVNNYLNQYEAAIEYYNTALQIDPNYQDAINNIGITYRDAGRYYGEEKQDLNNALKYLQLAYQYRPKEYETLRLLGIAHAIKGDTQRAISFFQQAVDLQPQNADALYNLGSAYYNAGNAAQGQVIHERALQIDPEVIERNQKR
ncbi:MAG: tetratricopeptide repeat protein, partial [Bacteroidota bacterium]